MAKSGQERSAKAALKRIEFDEKELRHRCRLGTRQKLEELMAWNDDTEQASVIEGCLRYIHSLGRDGAREALKTRHEIVISENVARAFRNQSLAELKRDPGDDIIAPVQILTYS
ncbi:hypothetical protein [Pseudomonas moraviensis]|uniref:hypothetical protein n=1 Tax=Pseudomonas moraviensis TaxID=321662 RepID=UPI000937FA39|nr:hypothetical protein [Pseudomonas moraviensis]OJT50014.1 hypothetical protein BSZ28_18455 [Pseudomonas moraviensis]